MSPAVIDFYIGLDFYIYIDDKKLKTLYDKRDSFNFNVVRYPFVRDSNIPTGPAYGVYSSRLISMARACDDFNSFKERHDRLCIKLMKQGFQYNRLCKQPKKSLRKHQVLFRKYDSTIEVRPAIMASQMRHVTLRT